MDGTAGASSEDRIRDIGRALHAALPGRSRHPVRAMDAKAMELASRDAELRAALFRLVDVTPACRSLDDLARHLRDYLGEVGERPRPWSRRMRVADTRAGRRALGLAAAGGVRHMAHRFIVGDSPRAALASAARPVGRTARPARWTCSARPRSLAAEADRYAARCRRGARELARGGRPLAGAARRWSRTRSARCRA